MATLQPHTPRLPAQLPCQPHRITGRLIPDFRSLEEVPVVEVVTVLYQVGLWFEIRYSQEQKSTNAYLISPM